MIIFSLILLTANRMIQRNTIMQLEGEMEREVIAVAQDIIEEGRTLEFDEVSVDAAAPPADIPGDFIPASNLGPDTGESTRSDFDDFDDFNGWEQTVETEHGEFNIRSEVFYVTPDTYDSTGTQTTFKQIRVFVTSQFLQKNNQQNLYRLEFIRNYYAD
jgi:hypothetical protein